MRTRIAVAWEGALQGPTWQEWMLAVFLRMVLRNPTPHCQVPSPRRAGTINNYPVFSSDCRSFIGSVEN